MIYNLLFFPHKTLKDYQRRLDTSGLKPSLELYTEYRVRGRLMTHCTQLASCNSRNVLEKVLSDLSLFQSLDMTTRSMIYEGPLTWRVTKEKALGNFCSLSLSGTVFITRLSV